MDLPECIYIMHIFVCTKVIDKGYSVSEAFLFKPRGGRSPPCGLNRKPRKSILYLACSMAQAQAQINMCY